MPLVLRSAKGAPLTNAEVDANFTFVDGKAAAAQSAANTAQTSANTAQGAANTAQQSANNVQTALDTEMAALDFELDALRTATRQALYGDGPYPALDLQFAGATRLDPRVTFTRASTATYFDATGAMQTAAANEPRFTHDPVTGKALGLLIEKQATNLLLNSAAPATQNVTVTAAAHTLSFWGTGTVTLSGASAAGPLVGTGANNRVTLTFTPTAGTLTLTMSGSVTRAQLETGTLATSYIKTLASQVTRAVDTAMLATSGLSFNALEGTFFIDLLGKPPVEAFTDSVFSLASTPSNYLMAIELSSPIRVRSTFAGYDSMGIFSNYSGGPAKIALCFAGDSITLCVNGELKTTTNLIGRQAYEQAAYVALGRNDNPSRSCATYRNLAYYPRRLPNSELQAMTTP